MSQIDRNMRAFGALAVASPLAGRDEPWGAHARRVAHTTLIGLVDAILTWRERAQMRRRLMTLDDRLLKDIGVTRSEAHGEAEKPIWRV
jgi:uncharacterized protein YjiS (DUF1127 family)